MDLLVQIFIVLLYSLSCYALGSAVWFKTMGQHPGCRWLSRTAICVTSFLLGQCLLVFIWTLLFLGGYVSYWLVIAILAAGILVRLVLKPSIDLEIARNLRQAVVELWKRGWTVRILFLATILVLVQFGVQAAGPFLFYTGDSTAIYMVLPKLTAYTGRLTSPSGYELFLQIGLYGEFHYAALMTLGCGSVAKLFTYIEFIALAALMMTMARRFGLGRIGQLLTMAMLLTSSTVAFYVYDGKVDLYGATLGMAAWYWVFQIGRMHSPWLIRMIGFLCGMAVLAKLSLAVVLLPTIVLCAILQYRHENKQTDHSVALSNMTWFLGVLFLWMFVGYLPQIIKNTVLFTEPLSPFLYFGKNDSWLNQAWIPSRHVARTILLYPILLFFGRYPMQGGCLSPLAFAMIPLAFLIPFRIWREKRELLLVTLAGLLGTVIWIIARPAVLSPRYILPVLLLLFFPAAYIGEEILLSGKSLRILGAILLVLVVVLLGLEGMRCAPKGTFQRMKNPHYEGNYPDVRLANYINETVPPSTPILWLGYIRYWLNPDLILATHCPMYRENSLQTNTIQTYLIKNNIHYFLLDTNIYKLEKISPESDGILSKGTVLLQKEGNLELYRVDFDESIEATKNVDSGSNLRKNTVPFSQPAHP